MKHTLHTITSHPLCSCCLCCVSVAPVSDHLGKATSGARPVKTKSVDVSTSSSSIKTTPTKTTPTKRTRAVSSSGISRSSIARSFSKLRSPSSQASRLATIPKAKPTAAPGVTKATSSNGHLTNGGPAKGTRHAASVSASKKTPLSAGKASSSAKAKMEAKEKAKGKHVTAIADKQKKEVTDDKAIEEVVVVDKDVSVDQINKFFGESSKASVKALHVGSEEGEDGDGSGVVVSEDEDSVDGVLLATKNSSSNSLDIEAIKKKKEEM